MTEKEKVGIALRNLRTNNTDLGVSEVARKMNKSKVWLSQIETGKRNIYFDDAKELCKIYGIKISKLHNEGITVKEIAEILNVSDKTVNVYLPYQKGEYNSESPTENALRIRKCRNKNKEGD